MADKVCNKCGSRVHVSVNYCPYCKSSSFRNLNEITVPNNSLKYKLFYKGEENYFVLSKSKVAAVLTFIVFFTASVFNSPLNGIFISVVVALLIYALGYSFRKAFKLDHTNHAVLRHNDYGLIDDLKHLFLYWQDKTTGQYIFSKTKSISLLILLFFMGVYSFFGPFNTLSMVLFGGFFATPVFLAGYAIHRFTTAEPVKQVIEKVQPQVETKKTVRTKPASSDFDEYRAKLNELKRVYQYKETKVRELIEKKFEPPQLTYTRFITSVDNCTEIFDTQADEVESIINLSTELNARIKEELDTKIGVMESIIDKLNELSSELILALDDDEEDHETSNVIDEMENLIRSVKDYGM